MDDHEQRLVVLQLAQAGPLERQELVELQVAGIRDGHNRSSSRLGGGGDPAIVTAVPFGRWPWRSASARTARATSSGVINRACDAEANSAESAVSGSFPVFVTTRRMDSCVISVSTNPGQTALHVTPVPA